MTATSSDRSTLRPPSIASHRLPPTLRAIHDLVGRQATLALVERYGGTHVHPPCRYRADHPLVALMGAEAAERFIRRFGGVRLYIAKMDAVLRARRNAEIRKLFDDGCTASDRKSVV